MSIDVRVPATSANLGPGFDVLGLALGLYNEIAYEEADRVSVTVEGEGAGRLDTGAGNVVARAALMAHEAAGRPFTGAAIQCVNRIPTARGLGSSGAGWGGRARRRHGDRGPPPRPPRRPGAARPSRGAPRQRCRRAPGRSHGLVRLWRSRLRRLPADAGRPTCGGFL